MVCIQTINMFEICSMDQFVLMFIVGITLLFESKFFNLIQSYKFRILFRVYVEFVMDSPYQSLFIILQSSFVKIVVSRFRFQVLLLQLQIWNNLFQSTDILLHFPFLIESMFWFICDLMPSNVAMKWCFNYDCLCKFKNNLCCRLWSPFTNRFLLNKNN